MDRDTTRSRAASAQRSEQRTVVPLRRAGAAVRSGETMQLQLLGPFALQSGSRGVGALPKKAQALLAYLAMQGGGAPREQLAELLWGASGGDQARRSLRQCLMAVRAALVGGNALIGEGDRVSLVAGSAMTVDVATFESFAASQEVGDLEAAQALYRGEFLSGLAIASESFSEWLLVERRRMASAMSDVLYRLAKGHADAGAIEQALPVAERLVAFDALREDGHRLLMQLLAQAGRRDAALKQHARCVELLRRDLGVAPELATTAIADAIRGGHTAAEPAVTPAVVQSLASPMLALPDKPSIALLPFSNLSGSADQDYFADGIADDLTIALGRIPWLFVIASSSTSHYRADAPDVRQIGSELGVRYVLRGSVRRGGERLRIVVQLTDASDGRHVWSDRFEGGVDDVFAIQDQVTAQVAGSIAPALQIAEIDRARRKPPESLSAYELYLRAVPRFRTSLGENREAVRLLAKAIEIDPAYGAAYGFASRCYQFQKLLGWIAPTDASLDEGVRLGQIAADIGQNDSEALWMAGHALSQLAGESERGAALIERSLVLNPNSANAWVSSCNVRSYIGDARTAIEHFARAERLNPIDSMHHVRWNILALAHLSAGDIEEAERAADKGVHAAPRYAPALRMKIVACGLLGRADEAREYVKQLLKLNPTQTVAWLRAFWGPTMRQHPALLTRMVEGARLAGLPEGDP
jgi:TolB-like protein